MRILSITLLVLVTSFYGAWAELQRFGLQWTDPDHRTQAWSYREAGKEEIHVFHLVREQERRVLQQDSDCTIQPLQVYRNREPEQPRAAVFTRKKIEEQCGRNSGSWKDDGDCTCRKCSCK